MLYNKNKKIVKHVINNTIAEYQLKRKLIKQSLLKRRNRIGKIRID